MRALCIAVLLLSSVPAGAKDIHEDVVLTKGPPIHGTVSPYDEALTCLAGQLTPEQKQTSFAAGFFPDRTGKINYVAEAGTGSFSSQGLEDIIITSLYKAGVMVVDSAPLYRQHEDWIIAKMVQGGVASQVRMVNPDVVINGAITGFDFLPGGGFSANIAGAKIGHTQSRILVTMDARAVVMPGAGVSLGRAGQVIATSPSMKQIVSYEEGAGVARFFGPSNSAQYVSLDFGHKPNEAIHYAERLMVERTVFQLVSKTFKVQACNETLDYADKVVNLQ